MTTVPSLRERALQCLARREHTRVELARKLASYAESPEEIEGLLDELTAGRLLSDVRYAESRVRTRGARYGNTRLVQELHAAGVEGELVRQALDEAGDELTRAKDVWQRKYGRSGLPADAAERLRQTHFLMRRGFSGETIRRLFRGDLEGD